MAAPSARCVDCGARFHRERGATWKRRCYACWRIWKDADNSPPRALPAVIGELPERLRALLQLCHPDRHGGSPLAASTTTWLLRVREELRT